METSWYLVFGGFGLGCILGFLFGYIKAACNIANEEMENLLRENEIRRIAKEEFETLNNQRRKS